MSRFGVSQWAAMDPPTRMHLRWTYRMMRVDGVRRSTARMYITSALNAGYTAGRNSTRASA